MDIKKKIKRFFNTVIYKELDKNEDATDIGFWKNRIFSLLSFFLVFLGGPVLLYGSYLFYSAGNTILALIEAAFVGTFLVAAYKKNLKIDYRKLIIILSIYAISIILLIYTGPYGAGMTSVVFSFILGVSLLNKKHNNFFFVMNIVIFVVLTVSLSLGYFGGLAIEAFENTWMVNAITTQLYVLTLIYLFNIIYDGLGKQTQKIIESKSLLAASEEKYRLLADTTADVIWVFNINTEKFIYISPSIENLRGVTVKEAMAERLDETMTTKCAQVFRKEISRTAKEFIAEPEFPKRYINEIQQTCKNGDLIWVEVSSRYRYNELGEIEIVSSSRNVNERKLKEKEILYIDFHDPLTGLLNRKAFTKSMYETTNGQERSVIIINIDNFRIINDALGHREGDEVLSEMATKIANSVDENDLVYRYGGDEFMIIVGSLDNQRVQKLARQVLKTISTQFMVKKRLFYLTASIGISLGSEMVDLEQTVKNADTALYIAKKQKNSITIYGPEMDQTRTREAILEEDLKIALEKGEFELVYQPIYDLKNCEINQAEALLRWNHSYLGMISPIDFIPIAEKTKLIIPITDWVISEVCEKIKQWQDIGIDKMTVSINISLLSLENRGAELTKSVSSGIRKAGIKAEKVKLEITESILIRDTDEIINVFDDLKRIGVKLALDDFGTGYSSFGCMKDLPLDIIKLDRSLISNIVIDEREQMITESMITIIHALDIQVVAEGVETKEQLEFLKQYGCDLIQGFFFSRPLPASAFIEYYFSMKKIG